MKIVSKNLDKTERIPKEIDVSLMQADRWEIVTPRQAVDNMRKYMFPFDDEEYD